EGGEVVEEWKGGSPPRLGQVRDLLERPRRALVTKCHRVAVQAAERAVRLRPPPAAARCFAHEYGGDHRGGTAAIESAEVVGEVGDGMRVQIVHRRGRSGDER